MTVPIIVGAGLAGSAAAIRLAQAGAPPLVLERSVVTGDAICGGFLSWRSLETLASLGIDRDALGGSVVMQARLFHQQRQVSARLPLPGAGVSRHRLDTLLQNRAIVLGATIERDVNVRQVAAGQVGASDGRQWSSPTIFLATGKHAIAGHPRIAPAGVRDDPVAGLRVRIAPSATLAALIADHIELFLFDRGYAGLVLQEDGGANLCLAVHKSRLAEAGARPETLLDQWADDCPALADRLAIGTTGRVDAIGAVPYGWQADMGTDGLWRLGDQAAVIPSLAGEGMGIALASADDAVAAWRRGEDAGAWQRAFAARLRRPMRAASLAWRIAETPWMTAPALGLIGRVPRLIDYLARATRVPA